MPSKRLDRLNRLAEPDQTIELNDAIGVYGLEAMIQKTLADALDPVDYLKSLGFDPFDWQEYVLDETHKRTILLSARQSGKSTIISSKAIKRAKYHPGALILILCPSQPQSVELMKKMEGFMRLDKDLPPLVHDTVFEKEFVNGSRIVALPGTERSVRSYSAPDMIIIDEASRVEDASYKAVRPMMVGADTELILMSTPFGKRGFFYNEWTNGINWNKVVVRPPFKLVNGRLIELTKEELEEMFPNVTCFFSPRHTKKFLEEELASLGELWFRQEYLCEFVETEDSVFSYEQLENAFTDIEALFDQDVDVEDVGEDVEGILEEYKV